jgi:ribosomal protein S19
MAQNITIELTDAQWALVVANAGEAFQIPDIQGQNENGVYNGVYTPVTITEDIISAKLKDFLTTKITRRIQEKAQTAQGDAFNV